MSMSLTSPRTTLRAGRRAAALVLSALVGMTSSVARAQATLAGDPPIAPFSNFYLATGKVLFDVGKINAHFTQANGFYEISNDAYSVGGGFSVPFGKLMIGAQYHYFDIGIETSPQGKTDQITSKFAIIDIGYNFVNSWHWNLYGSFGVGVGTATLILRNRSGGATVSETVDPTFDEILASPGLKSEVIGTYFILAPSLGADYLVLANTDSHIGLTLGFRVTSAITPNRTTWKYKGRDVFGAPDGGPAGAQIRLQFGVGGFRLAPRRR